MSVVPLTLRSHTQVHRGKHKRRDDDLHTTRLVGGGWWWECDCGAKGGWSAERRTAFEQARTHRQEAHGQR